MTDKFKRLLEPGNIGRVKTRNRIIKSGAAMRYWHTDDLHMSGTVKAFYEALAAGGVGLLIVESPVIDYPSGTRFHRYRIDADKYIAGLRELTSIIHQHDCPVFMQMNHDGPWQTHHFAQQIFSGPPVAASPVYLPGIEGDFHNEKPRELSISEIEEIVARFAGAALRARLAGFDGVDLNAASSHLLHNFLSPFWNKRRDIYGGSLENRARLVVEIIKSIKKSAGQDFAVAVCLNGIEIGQAIGVDNRECLTLADSCRTARLLQDAGADALQVRNIWLGCHTGGFLPEHLFYPEPPVPLKSFPEEYDWKRRGPGANIRLAESIKQAVSIPVIAVGRFDPELGESTLKAGKADFIAMTRRLMADPDLPAKVASGRLEDIAPCTACGTCLGHRYPNRRCRINARLGSEKYALEKAPRTKKVVVVGGGPGGMEAARVAAQRGHQVWLFEKQPRLGGLLFQAAVVKGLEIENLPALVRYYQIQLKKLGVRVRLGKQFTNSSAAAIRPEVVILATGGVDNVPDIPGINHRKVISSASLHRLLNFGLSFLGPRKLRWITRFWLPLGKNVAIIGGGIQGCELAEFLVKRGRKVILIEESEKLGEGMEDFLQTALFKWFHLKGVRLMPGTTVQEITDDGLVVVGPAGIQETVAADSIVTALPLKPDRQRLNELKSLVPEVYAVGDCQQPALIVDAVAAGWRISSSL